MANTELRSVEQCKMPWGQGEHDRTDSSWSFCSPMCQPRTALGACALKDKIYAVGGQACLCCYAFKLSLPVRLCHQASSAAHACLSCCSCRGVSAEAAGSTSL